MSTSTVAPATPAGDAEEGHDAGAGDLAADLRHRQQCVDRFTDEAHPDADGGRVAARLPGKDDPPAQPGAGDFDRAQDDHHGEAVADGRKSRRDRADTL